MGSLSPIWTMDEGHAVGAWIAGTRSLEHTRWEIHWDLQNGAGTAEEVPLSWYQAALLTSAGIA